MTSYLLSPAWIAQLETYRKLIVGFSGGLDSTVLLHVLASVKSLKDKLLAVHINHSISPNAKIWQNQAEEVSKKLKVDFLAKTVEFNRQSNIEANAREVRYEFLSSLTLESDCLVLGHHKDDQVETVLLQLFRGAGIDGLAAMPELRSSASKNIARPLLSFSRFELEEYAKEKNIKWINDESNQDIHYSRNFLRHTIIPLIEEKWPGVNESIFRSASHCQQAIENLEALALMDCPELQKNESHLNTANLRGLNFSRISNVIRQWLKGKVVNMPSTTTLARIINEVIYARRDANPLVAWEGGTIRRYKELLYLLVSIDRNEIKRPKVAHDKDRAILAQAVSQGLIIPENALVEIRYRKGGEKIILHGQTKSLKKLFQEWCVPPWKRSEVPLVYIDNTLCAVVGYAISD